MIQLSLKQLVAITQGCIKGDENISIQGINIDSRRHLPGRLFVAIKGERFDGHDYIDHAIANGAVAVLGSKEMPSLGIPYIKVNNTIEALGKIAKYWRNQFNIPIIALTGSNGKTTTKNMIHKILLSAHHEDVNTVLATEGNLNNHIGLPLMLIQLNAKHKIAVIEMGMNHFNEISYLTHLATPTTALITNAGPCHLEGVGGTVAGVAKAKGEIFEGLNKEGIAVINADDEFAEYWKKMVSDKRIITYGIEKNADIRGEIINGGFKLHYQNQTVEIKLQLLGRHNVMNALAASAATLFNGAQLHDVKNALEAMKPAAGRMQTKAGRKGVTIIDDTYNANPLSLRAALTTITDYQGKKILVLGDMRELGEQAKQLHIDSGKLAKALGITILLATGDLTQHTVKSFGENGLHFPDHASLIQALENYLTPDTTVLVKGSRSMKMEQVVNALIIQEQ